VNLLLLLPDEVSRDTAIVEGPRAAHLLGVLGKGVGDPVKAGILGLGLCPAEVTAIGRAAARVELRLGPVVPSREPQTCLILALPRPKGLSRIVQLAASLGVRRLDLVGAHKVDPAYFSSPRLHPDRLKSDAHLGLEQGGLVHLPLLVVHRHLEEVVRPVRAGAGGTHVLFDPSAEDAMPAALEGPSWHRDAEVVLAFGPDGGFVPEEVELFRRAGYELATLSRSTLRTEVAVAVGLGQLELCRRLAKPAPALPTN